MSYAESYADAETRQSRKRAIVLTLIIAVTGVIGSVAKQGFGHLLLTIVGHPTTPHHYTVWQWLTNTELGRLAMAMVACLIFAPASKLRFAPLIERIVYRDPTVPKTKIIIPGLVCALVSVAIFIVTVELGIGPDVVNSMSGAHRPTPEQMHRLLMLWPFGFVGAGLSEEALYRFGMITPVIGLVCILTRGNTRAAAVAFWVANIGQAFVFGMGHVIEGVGASAVGGVLVATLVAPQTWAGLVFGYCYKRWGFEAAAFSHMVGDSIGVAVAIPLLGMVH